MLISTSKNIYLEAIRVIWHYHPIYKLVQKEITYTYITAKLS